MSSEYRPLTPAERLRFHMELIRESMKPGGTHENTIKIIVEFLEIITQEIEAREIG